MTRRSAWPVAELRTTAIGGAPIGVVTEAEVVEGILGGAAKGTGLWTVTANLDHLRRYRTDPEAKRLIDEADLVVADGMPLVWASRLAGTPLPERINGTNLIWALCEAAARRGQSISLVGGGPGLAASSAEVLARRYPDLEVAGAVCPPLGFEHDADEMERLGAALRAASPDLVFVGLGFTKQDLFIRRLRPLLPASSFIGVGGAFDFISGQLSRAPRWGQDMGLEWLFRLAQEPRRLARRYLIDGGPFALSLLGTAAFSRVRGAPASVPASPRPRPRQQGRAGEESGAATKVGADSGPMAG
jgi:N-acetylglucosaminyldiphosphoundecaprenol N-acetyl-beta-D-mannosaminyltransferase